MKLRLFLTVWIVFSLHFATNIVREHYPAFALIERGDFRCDDYAGFHSDIFEHERGDGHHYVGNQVTASVIAAVPLLAFKPLLDALVRDPGEIQGEAHYETEYPLRAAFFAKARERGLHLRFGAAAAITSVLLMAPLGGLFTVAVFAFLAGRGVERGRAAWLAVLAALATPVFYRSAHLSHNVFLAYAVFGSFLLVRLPAERDPPLSRGRLLAGGLLAGLGLALDYAGVVPLLCLFGYVVATHWRGLGAGGAFRAAVPFVLGSVPPVLFLLYSQWDMYGNPFLPGQYWMPAVNYTDEGWRGFSLPQADLFAANLLDLDWGLLPFAPLLALAFVPALWYPRDSLVLPRRDRRFVWVLVAAFLLFCAANQYSRMQWNTGFRYLLPLVPFLFLALSDHLVRLPRPLLVLVAVPAVLHGWVLAMWRYTPPERGDPQAVPESWRRFLDEGVRLPWLNTLKSTDALDLPFLDSPLLPYAVLAAGVVALLAVWSAGRSPGRRAARNARRPPGR